MIRGEKMNKIDIIIPYFGSLPNYYDVWKKSVIKNETIDFYLVTDIKNIKNEKNIHVIYTTLQELKDKISMMLKLEVSLEVPYKLCDYRPAYGEIFRDILNEYDFWGYCDMDLVFGNIREFITDEILNKNERILLLGHLSLFKNTTKMNNLYKDNGTYPEKNYIEVFQTPDSWYFDEFGGMYTKCLRNSINLFNNAPIANLLPVYPFFEYHGKPVIIEWNNGKCFAISDTDKVELLYAHFSKRKFKIKTSSDFVDVISILPTEIRFGENANRNDIVKVTKKKLYRIMYLYIRNKNSKNSIYKNINRYIWGFKVTRYIKQCESTYKY